MTIELTRAAFAALERGALDEAERHCRALGAHAPQDANVALLAGLIAYRRKQFAQAAASLAEATRRAPHAFGAWFWRGNAEREQGHHAQAIRCYRQAQQLEPKHAEAAYNLGQSLKDTGDWAQAGPMLVQSGRAHGDDINATRAVVDCAAALARSDQPVPDNRRIKLATNAALLSFVVCSITPSKLNALRRNISERLGSNPWELIHIPDAKSLCEGYMRGMSRALGKILIFCHDDIEILGEDFHARLLDALEDADVVGVAGTTKIAGPGIAWAGRPYLHGWVTHQNPSAAYLPSIFGLASARIDNAQALDGLFIAAHRHVAEQIRFDADTFDGFHFYDIDFSYRAWQAGMRVRIQCDVLLRHASRGEFDAAHRQYAELFCRKFPHLTSTAPSTRNGLFEVAVADREHVLRFYAWISHWLG